MQESINEWLPKPSEKDLPKPSEKKECPKCGELGYLYQKEIVSKGKSYYYWYFAHEREKKVRWCYIGKEKPSLR